jgi:hypothetical protein
MCISLHAEYTLFLLDFIETRIFFFFFRKILKHEISQKSVQWATQVFRADRRTYMTTPKLAFRNSSNSPDNNIPQSFQLAVPTNVHTHATWNVRIFRKCVAWFYRIHQCVFATAYTSQCQEWQVAHCRTPQHNKCRTPQHNKLLCVIRKYKNSSLLLQIFKQIITFCHVPMSWNGTSLLSEKQRAIRDWRQARSTPVGTFIHTTQPHFH